MNIELSIDELVLDGIDVAHQEFIRPAIERELARLFFMNGPRPWMNNRENLNLADLNIEIPRGLKPEAVGAHIARDIYTRMNTPAPPKPTHQSAPTRAAVPPRTHQPDPRRQP